MKKAGMLLLGLFLFGIMAVSMVSAHLCSSGDTYGGKDIICDAEDRGTIRYTSTVCYGDTVIYRYHVSREEYFCKYRDGQTCNGDFWYWDDCSREIENCTESGQMCLNGECKHSTEECLMYELPSAFTLYDSSEEQQEHTFIFPSYGYVTRVIINWRNFEGGRNQGCDGQVTVGGEYLGQTNNMPADGITTEFNDVNTESEYIYIQITDFEHTSESCGGVVIDSIEVYGHSEECIPEGEAYWADMLGTPINNSDKNDEVKLVVLGSYESDQLINYFVKKDIPWWFDSKIVESSEYGFTTWRAGLKDNGDIDTGDNFYFLAESDAFAKESGFLDVGEENNSMPVAVITNPPEEEEVYRNEVNVNIDFEQASYDEDDDLRVTWNFGDGNFENHDYCQTDNACNTQHNYSRNGIYMVGLTASEMERNQSDTDSVFIEILKEGINVMPIITKPVGSTGYGNIVEFDGSQSYVANCSYSMTDYDFEAGALKCKYIHSKGSLTTTGDYDLYAEWSFPTDPGVEGVEGDWSNETAMFTEFFPTAGSHTARLRLTYTEV